MNGIKRVKCIIPFTDFMVNVHGYCYSCCPMWTRIGNVGKLTLQNSIMDVWNNERMQYLRKAILDDRLEKVCNFKYCPYAMKNEYLYVETMKNEDPNYNRIIDQILAGKTVMDNSPYLLNIAVSGKCNLRCVMCRSNDQYLPDDGRLATRLFTQVIPEILPGISRLFLVGNGEVLFNPLSRNFLQSLDAKLYPFLKINLLTNGLLFTPKLWETIGHNRYDSIFVSVDAASKETYEKIRKNGNWERLRRNLDLISELRRQHVFAHFSINFCVMKSNYQEMKNFVELGLQLGCDQIVFQKIFGLVDVRENINFTNHHKAYHEIGRLMMDPIFNRPEVNHTQIDEYQKYAGKAAGRGEALAPKVKERILYYPIRGFFSLLKYFPFVLDIYEFFHQKKVPTGVHRNAPGVMDPK